MSGKLFGQLLHRHFPESLNTLALGVRPQLPHFFFTKPVGVHRDFFPVKHIVAGGNAGGFLDFFFHFPKALPRSGIKDINKNRTIRRMHLEKHPFCRVRLPRRFFPLKPHFQFEQTLIFLAVQCNHFMHFKENRVVISLSRGKHHFFQPLVINAVNRDIPLLRRLPLDGRPVIRIRCLYAARYRGGHGGGEHINIRPSFLKHDFTFGRYADKINGRMRNALTMSFGKTDLLICLLAGIPIVNIHLSISTAVLKTVKTAFEKL